MIRRLATVLLTGYVFIFFSEISFWARPLASVTWPGIIGIWLVYSFSAWVFIGIIGLFEVKYWSAIFLAGSLFGWLTEGVLVQTMYDDVPFNISFTGLAWHALFTVMIGWYVLPRMLRKGFWQTTGVSALVGIGLGVWALTWWVEDGQATTLLTFASFVTIVTLLLALAYLALSRIAPDTMQLGRVEWIVVSLCIIAWYVLVAIPAQPLALIILPPCVVLAVFGLWRFRQRGSLTRERAWDNVTRTFPSHHILGLVALPITAISVYTLALLGGIVIKTGIFLYLITMPLGFFLFFRALLQAIRLRKSVPPTPVAISEILSTAE